MWKGPVSMANMDHLSIYSPCFFTFKYVQEYYRPTTWLPDLAEILMSLK